jgi:hypothetical protein
MNQQIDGPQPGRGGRGLISDKLPGAAKGVQADPGKDHDHQGNPGKCADFFPEANGEGIKGNSFDALINIR